MRRVQCTNTEAKKAGAAAQTLDALRNEIASVNGELAGIFRT
jgi:hypothetical protein